MHDRSTRQLVHRQIGLFYAALLCFLVLVIPALGFVSLSIAADNLATSVSNNLVLGNYRDAVISLEPFSTRYFDSVTYAGISGREVFSVGENKREESPISFGLIAIREEIGLPGSSTRMGHLEFRYQGFSHAWYGALLWAVFAVLSIPVTLRIRNRMIGQLQKDREDQKNAAIARTTQMLAHDVRKPFSLIRTTLATLNQVTTFEQTQGFISAASPAIERSINSVSSLLDDIMEIDRKVPPKVEQHELPQLLAKAREDVLRISDETTVTFEKEYDSERRVLVDVDKIHRVFTNIIGNALEAVRANPEAENPRVWFRSEDCRTNGRDCVLVTIGNSGSYIPPAELKRLFEAFYTKGKKDGTGLGLAIVQKIVNDHGGRVWAESSDQEAVEFKLILPAFEN